MLFNTPVFTRAPNGTSIRYNKIAVNPLLSKLVYSEVSTATTHRLFTMDMTNTNTNSDTTISSVNGTETINWVAFSPYGQYFAAAGASKKLYVYNSTNLTANSLDSIWTTSLDASAIVFNRDNTNHLIYAADKNGQILVLGFNCYQNCAA
jgi:WD40 repeat protein